MPITSSAKKALRASERKTVFNARRKKSVKDVTVEIRRLVRDGKAKEAEALVSKAYKAIDKAVKGKTLKKGTGSRKKSRLVKMVNKTNK